MVADIFQYYKYRNSCNSTWYDFRICENKFIFNEYEAILFIVSCIRANYEVHLLCADNHYDVICASLAFSPVDIIGHAELHGLKITWDGHDVVITMDEMPELLLSHSDFISIADAMCELLNLEYCKDILNVRDLDSVYLEHMLGADLPFIQSKEFIEVPILSLRVFSKDSETFIPIDEHPYYLQLVNKNLNAFGQCLTNHTFETTEFRYRRLIASLIVNGYPYKSNYIITYNDDMIVRDGTHRLAILYKMYGNIKFR